MALPKFAIPNFRAASKKNLSTCLIVGCLDVPRSSVVSLCDEIHMGILLNLVATEPLLRLTTYIFPVSKIKFGRNYQRACGGHLVAQ